MTVLSVAGSSILMYSFRNLRPGWRRAPVAIVTASLNLLLPKLFNAEDELVTMALLSLNTMWLGTFKV